MTEERRRAELAAKTGDASRRPEDLVTVSYLVMRWDVDRKTIYKFIANGLLEALDMPDVGWRVRYSSVLAFEKNHTR